ncbi:MAG: hypothetical protein JWM21_4480 [Acidobacteria bacterium]|nr:hypothetical protein [Acidobacteriota bacterium]
MLSSITTGFITIAILGATPFALLRAVRFYYEVIEPYRKRTGYVVVYISMR